jgi:hypothetical protein
MVRMLGAFLVAVLVAGCTSTPTSSPALFQPSPSANAASLSITGSGRLCGPWWRGCGAYLAIEQTGWRLPGDWTPSNDDIQFDLALRAGSERGPRVTGVLEPVPHRIEPGDYLLVGILTRTPDCCESPPATSASLGCSLEVSIPPGTRAVTIDVQFGEACAIEVVLDGATPAPSG